MNLLISPLDALVPSEEQTRRALAQAAVAEMGQLKVAQAEGAQRVAIIGLESNDSAMIIGPYRLQQLQELAREMIEESEQAARSGLRQLYLAARVSATKCTSGSQIPSLDELERKILRDIAQEVTLLVHAYLTLGFSTTSIAEPSAAEEIIRSLFNQDEHLTVQIIFQRMFGDSTSVNALSSASDSLAQIAPTFLPLRNKIQAIQSLINDPNGDPFVTKLSKLQALLEELSKTLPNASHIDNLLNNVAAVNRSFESARNAHNLARRIDISSNAILLNIRFQQEVDTALRNIELAQRTAYSTILEHFKEGTDRLLGAADSKKPSPNAELIDLLHRTIANLERADRNDPRHSEK